MPIHFSDAVAAVYALRQQNWRGTIGTLHVSTNGLEDDDDFLVVWGAREWLVEGNPSYELLNNTATLVSKETGEVRDVPATSIFDKVDGMTPVVT
jgi:hypothetical protein